MNEPRVGRNAACPCGSGKKYKRCCLELQQRTGDRELAWTRCSQANDRLADRLAAMLPELLDPRLIAEARREFDLWQPPVHPLFASREIHNVFYDWLFFRYVPDPLERRDPDLEPPLGSIAALCLERHARRLSKLEQRILRAGLARGNSLLAIREVRPGVGLRAEDLFTNEIFELVEREGSKGTRAGMILFAHVAALPELPHLLACSPLPLPAEAEPAIRYAREELEPDPDANWQLADVIRHDTEIRDLYYELLADDPTRAAPEASLVQNSCSEPPGERYLTP